MIYLMRLFLLAHLIGNYVDLQEILRSFQLLKINFGLTRRVIRFCICPEITLISLYCCTASEYKNITKTVV